MKIDIDDNIIDIVLSEEEAEKIKLIYPGGHEHFRDKHYEIVINKE